MVRAKFKVKEKRDIFVGGGNVHVTVAMEACTTGPGNESWAKWTPSGKLEMTVTNPEAVAQLELGKDYFFDIYPADAQ